MKNGQIDLGFLLPGGLGLHAVQVEMAERAGGDHDIRSVHFGVTRMSGDHGERVFFIDRENGEPAAARLSRKVDDPGSKNFNDPL